MNALDQALIKAFAKNRSAVCGEQESAAIGSRVQPPETGVESTALVLHDLNPQGLRFRIDRPTSTEASYLAAHMIMPIVEQVQSYHPDDIATSTLSQVIIEDRLQSLEQSLREIEESTANDADGVAVPIREEIAPAHHGLSEAEEAALLGGVKQSVLDPFAPAWEVDAFRWPDLCTELDAASGRKLTRSGDELYVATQDGLKVIAITSTERQEGRTTMALSLARGAAAAGCRVALLDADCANPELARRLGLDSPCDWQQVRRHRQPLCEAAVASLDDHVTLFPLAVPDDDLSGRLDDPTLTGVLRELKRSFDLVVVDTQPVAAGDTRVAVATCPCEVDMVVVVRNIQTTSQNSCLSTVARLRAMGVRAVGIVENFAPADEAAV
jgi:Mrp family chromosome partitioning ATPase